MPAVVPDVVCMVPFGSIFPINTNAPEVSPLMAPPVNSIPPINDNVFEGRRATVLDDTERACPELPQLPDDMPLAGSNKSEIAKAMAGDEDMCTVCLERR